jgi:hypothetical protein
MGGTRTLPSPPPELHVGSSCNCKDGGGAALLPLSSCSLPPLLFNLKANPNPRSCAPLVTTGRLPVAGSVVRWSGPAHPEVWGPLPPPVTALSINVSLPPAMRYGGDVAPPAPVLLPAHLGAAGPPFIAAFPPPTTRSGGDVSPLLGPPPAI